MSQEMYSDINQDKKKKDAQHSFQEMLQSLFYYAFGLCYPFSNTHSYIYLGPNY